MIDSEYENNYVFTTLTKRKRFFIYSKSKDVFKAFVIEEKSVNKMN